MADGLVEPIVIVLSSSRVNSFGGDYDYDGVFGNGNDFGGELFGNENHRLFEQDESSSPASFCGCHLNECDSETRISGSKIDEVEESRDRDDTTITSWREYWSSSLSLSTKGWGMGYRLGSRLTRSYDDNVVGRRRDSCKPDVKSLFLPSKAHVCDLSAPKIDRHDLTDRFGSKHQSPVLEQVRPSSGSSGPKAGFTSTSATSRPFSVIACILILIAEFTTKGDAFSSSCVAEQCAVEFMRALDHDKVLIGPNLPYCTLLTNYGSCLNRTSRACRGNLKFHSLNTMVMTQIRDHNCTALIEYRRKMGSSIKSPTVKPIRTNITSDIPDDDVVGPGAGSNGGRCLFPYQHQKGSGGYRYCGMFGDPHLRTFEGQYETCRTLGAWPLIDNSYFGVQVTNDPVAEGVDASGISKVTVIVKSLPGCTDQKMFEATKDFLPSTFVDGTTNSGDPNTNSISGASYYIASSFDNRGAESEHRPAVLVRAMEPDRHVEIHLRYISTRVVIRRAGSYLTVAIKIPEEVLVQRTSLNTLQLCITGCPSTERINYKEVLAYPEYYVKKWGARSPAMSREQAMDICRQAGVTDFFFDSCVFDLLMTGDETFKDSALAAMNDIRQLYPPYRKHYETRRSDLQLYEELAKLGRELEHEEREHGHKRRQPGPYWDTDERQSDDREKPETGDSTASARARLSRTNSGTKGSRELRFGTLLLCLVLVDYLRRCGQRW